MSGRFAIHFGGALEQPLLALFLDRSHAVAVGYPGQPPAQWMPQPPPRPKNKGPLYLLIMVGVLTVAALVVGAYFFGHRQGVTDERDKIITHILTPFAATKLSHAAVESYIAQQYSATGVSCNGGQDFPMQTAGQSFPCTADGGRSFTVTITSTDGHYQVRPS